ncbi:hypothetical protein DFJ58DRAFT_786343 [Suillus subalutaceus]|uniref:uncharacterized protein n=1 Tax=Suillus subalutaceus TaxID=48586 RepID=UPI001B862016|nr:uncharacterized protein DFJ58DRAFT_786343 [Suillus subalutaceus]KAG1855144.1 hypothetical protein DFJ58DRAFT_786343 [Suillus subalutaceus]
MSEFSLSRFFINRTPSLFSNQLTTTTNTSQSWTELLKYSTIQQKAREQVLNFQTSKLQKMASAQVPTSLSSFPEELLARILADCVTPPQVLPVRPPWHTQPIFFPRPSLLARPTPHTSTRAPSSLLLVSRQFLRIGTPIYYQTLHLPTATHAARVLETLISQPIIADAVRRVVLGCVSLEGARVLRACEKIEDVDICMDVYEANPRGDAAEDQDAQALCDALDRLDLKHLTIRRISDAYLTLTRPKYLIERITKAVPGWPNLESVHYAFKISSTPATRPLAEALSHAPKLRSLKAQLPEIWNELFLTISTNPTLEQVALYAEGVDGILHTTMYMMEARKHAHLNELIKVGTTFFRTRARTTAAAVPSPPSTRPSTPLSASRVKEVAAELMTPRLSQNVPPHVAGGSHVL